MSIKTLYDYFRKEGMNEYGAVGFLCNIGGESAFNANNAQNSGNRSLGMTDAEYTKALDNGSITRDMFVNKHKFGFGLCQWTYPSRKAAFYDFMKKNAKTFGDEMKQAEFIIKELKGYKSVWNFLCNAPSVREASDKVLLEYERPADTGEGEQKRRFAFAERIYKEIGQTESKPIKKPILPTKPKDYFPQYKGNTVSIVDALNDIGATSSYAYRKTIASANGIAGYKGTAAQNTKMLNLLKTGKLLKP